jgi:hypothetical protein
MDEEKAEARLRIAKVEDEETESRSGTEKVTESYSRIVKTEEAATIGEVLIETAEARIQAAETADLGDDVVADLRKKLPMCIVGRPIEL